MWKKETILILIILGLAYQMIFLDSVSAQKNYLPKADLIKGNGPEVYLLENGIKRWIPDPETFSRFRYNWQNIKRISDSVLNEYSKGDDLNKNDDYPEGSLIRGSGPRVYLIELGKKRWIPNPLVFNGNNFGWEYIIQIDDDDLDDYKKGSNLTNSESNRYPETLILQGPSEGETLKENEITFKYSGTNPLGPTGDLYFEAFLEGYDKNWRSVSRSGEKKYRLSSESKLYTFYIRAKNMEGYYDPTPASVSFNIGLSPSFGKVEIKRVKPSENKFNRDYLILENKDKSMINITNWKIETKKTTIIIPEGVKKLAYPFSKSDYSDIELAYRDEVVISASSSPKGVNFQTNKCTGYLSETSEFYPSLNKSCPKLEESEYSHLKESCRDFIEDIDRCRMADYSNNLDISADSECTDFLTKTFTYQSCYDEHNQEVNFFDGEWRVFLNKSTDIFENNTDTIILKDSNGLVVDRYSY